MEFNDVRLQQEQLSTEIESAIARVLSSGRYILGPAGQLFEEEFARYCQALSGVGVASGTDALSIGLAALGVRRGDEVMVPAVSAPATAMAVAKIGAVPVFVDISADDFTMDPADLFNKRSSRTRAIVPVHLYGMPARLKEIGREGLPILEDACQAHGSDAPWGRCGSFGSAAAFSFYPTKNLGTYGDGGMIVTSRPEVSERARLLRNYGQRENYASEILGENSRLDEIHAAILRVKLKRLDEWNGRRRDIAGLYRQAFRELPLKLQAETGKSNAHLFVVVTALRDDLRKHLLSAGIPSIVHYPVPLPRQKAFTEFAPAQCPNGDRLCARVLSLPIHASMSNRDVERVIDTVKGFFRNSSARSN
jgi:dTDP-3-amino-3,4,6-trideoxy-alpha-D-glucose transaminase